jgi:hypothetical protein
MAKCANCANDALYVYQITTDFDIKYCQYHLPRTLGKKGAVGVSVIEPVVEPAPTPAPKKKAEPVVEAPAEKTEDSGK